MEALVPVIGRSTQRMTSFDQARLRAARWSALVVALIGLASCSSGGSRAGTGGSAPANTGGTTAIGGASGAAGTTSAGGSIGTGGQLNTGGVTAIGGAGGSGGGSAGAKGGSGGGAAGRIGSPGGAGGTAGGAGGSAVQCPATVAKPGDSNESVVVGGTTRTFVRHVPTGYTGKQPVPVVFDFHPLGGSGSTWKSSTNWGSVADGQGFVMIWPDGVGNSWNVGRCCSTAQSQNVDDVGFVRAMVAKLQTELCVDPKRIYATGCSNGGGMAYKVACDAADLIAAVAPVDFDCVTGPTADPSCGSCTPARPISEIQFRGTSDSAVPYNGGSGPAGTMFPGAQKNFTSWGQINMCSGTPQALADNAACQAYPTCGGDVETTLCTVQNGTHCGNYQSFGIVNLAWGMFQKKTLP